MREDISPAHHGAALATAFVALFASAALAAPSTVPDYINQLSAPTASYSSPDARFSLSSSGSSAFSAIDPVDGFSKAWFAPCPIPPSLVGNSVPACLPALPVSFGASTRTFSAAGISDADNPQIVSVDRVSGAPPVFFLRKWPSNGSLAFTLLGKSPDNFSSATGYLGQANDGSVVDAVALGDSFIPAMNYYEGAGNSLAGQLSLGGQGTPHLQVARATGQVVVTDNLADRVLMYAPRFVGPARVIADHSGGYSSFGFAPGVSSDGSVVAFEATIGGKRAIYVSVDATNAAGTSTRLTPVVAEGADGLADLSAAESQRVAVTSRAGTTFTTRSGRRVAYQLLTIAFSGTADVGGAGALPGIYSRDLLIRIETPPQGAPRITIAAISLLSKVVAAGDLVGTETLISNFGVWDTAANSTAGIPGVTQADEQAPLVAFSAATASRVVLARGRRVCNIDTYAKADYKQFNYKKTILAGGKSSIAKGGCQLTALTNIANDRSRSNVNPAQANLILARTPFIRSKTGDVCVPVSASCPKGTPTVLPAREIINGDVEGDAAAALTQALGGPRLNTFFVDVDVPINKKTGVFQGAVPVLDSFLQNALSPVADFFACNHEPVVLRVPNCGTKCTQHFVLGKGKGTIQLAGQPNPNLTEFINDPGSSTITDLLQKGADGKGRHNTTFGLRAPTAASVPGATATHGGMVINVDSPLDVVVVDPLGRKFGTDPQSGQSFLDIENAEFLDDTIVDPDGVALQADTQTLVIGGPADAYGNVTGSGDGILDGTYTLQMTGTGAGPYKVSIQTTDVAGNGKTRYLIGTTAPGQYVEAYLARSSTVGSPFTVTTNTVPQRIPGDVVLDGVVNIDDVQAIFAAAGTPADGADDPMDLDADGQITVLDARKAALLCSKPQCAR